ncbi:GLUG motif-containing protein, partial [Sediminitomix flava]|uniref:GLUG motif-containing protein n=1 Tax=Sediminitomix flava TaxID=379075 RepID=UPI001B87934F
IGTGTISDPYQISNLSELRWLSEGLETGMSDSVRWSKHYLVTENINASETFHWNLEEGFSPIGTDKVPFTGSLNGQGFEVDSLTINRSEGKQIGLFGFVSDAHIHQLGLTDVSLLGKSSVGGLVGKAVGSIIERVYVSGDIESTEKSIGGLIGEIGKNTFVHRSYSLANVTGIRNVGGLLGACYNSSVLESYAVGIVLGEENNGGLVGQVNSTAKIEKSYWDTVTTQQTVSAGSKAKFGLSSENFAADSSFVDWNVDVVWTLETVSELDSLVRPYLFQDGNTNVHFISVADSVGGSISPRSLSLTEGETRVYKIKSENGYQIVDVFVDSVSQGALSEYTFVEVSSAHSISASFEKIPYEITVNVGSHGEVDSSSTTIFYDEVKTFKFIADEGYEIYSVYVNGEDLGVISEYTFQDIFANQTLEVFFIKSGLVVATELTMGSGTISDPYQISNLSELRWLSEGLETGMSDSVRWSKHYVVTENINASEAFHWNLEEGFSPIGTDKIPFTGSLNGQGFEID